MGFVSTFSKIAIKPNSNKMKMDYHLKVIAILLCSLFFSQLNGQEERESRPVRNTFESIWLIDNQTVDVPFQGTFEWDIQHRFGTIENGYDDYFGIAAPSNIRLGFNYVARQNLQLGFGITRQRKVWDFNAKYALYRQKMEGGFPFSITYFVNAAIDSRDLEFEEASDRFSYFHQLMIARKFSDRVSIQASPSLSYFNFPDQYITDQGVPEGLGNKHFALSLLTKLGVSDSKAIIANVDIPFTSHEIEGLDIDVDPKVNVSFGFEFTTSSHAFQIFIGNYSSIVPQYNHILNQNEFNKEGILIGFNMTRLWSF